MESNNPLRKDIINQGKEVNDDPAFKEKPPQPVLVDDADLCNATKDQLVEALKFIPENKVVAYKTALQHNPDLVSIESNLYKFFQRCNYNGWEVACRLCEYWTLRKEVFGEERWLKPVLDLTSTGALSETSKKLIDLDVCKIMPYDQLGRPVLLVDRTTLTLKVRKEYGFDTIHKIEAVFYFFQLLSELHNTAIDGISICYILHETTPKIYPNVHRFVSRAIQECFPIKMHTAYIVFAPNKVNKNSNTFARHFMPYIFEILKLPFAFTNITIDYIKPDDTNTSIYYYRGKLGHLLVQKYKMKFEFLPTIAGGSWTFQCFQKWYNNKSKSGQDDKTNLIIDHLPFQHIGQGQEEEEEVQKEDGTNNSSNINVILSPLELLAYVALRMTSAAPEGTTTDIKRDGQKLEANKSTKKPRSVP